VAKKVKTRWVVSIPEGAKVLVVEGQEVKADENLVEISGNNVKTINVSERFGALSGTDRAKLMGLLPGMKVTEGKVIYKTGGFFPKKIVLPITGEVINIDEFDNLHFKEAKNKIRKVTCPVDARVVKKDGKVLEMEFLAIEYGGRGISEGKAWGTKGLKEVLNLADLSSEDADKIIMTESLHPSWLIKAEVVGVRGVVVIDDNEGREGDRINSKLPILALEKDEWQELVKNVSEVKRAMINTANGSLLLVV
jgi:hypothetical protein